MRQGDPTPFKSFRYREYFATVGRMDIMPDNTPLSELLAQEILITEEVVQVVQRLLDAGALAFGISDKPDEASWPPQTSAAQGKQPIHRTRMKVAGQAG
jgi:hypothetical protein